MAEQPTLDKQSSSSEGMTPEERYSNPEYIRKKLDESVKAGEWLLYSLYLGRLGGFEYEGSKIKKIEVDNPEQYSETIESGLNQCVKESKWVTYASLFRQATHIGAIKNPEQYRKTIEQVLNQLAAKQEDLFFYTELLGAAIDIGAIKNPEQHRETIEKMLNQLVQSGKKEGWKYSDKSLLMNYQMLLDKATKMALFDEETLKKYWEIFERGREEFFADTRQSQM